MMHPDHSDHLTTLTTPTTRLPRPPRPLRPPTYTTPMYLCKVYFCEMYPTCVSCKLCEFIFWDTLYILCFHKNFPLRRGQKHAKRALRLARDNTDLDGQNQSALKAHLEGTPTPTSKFIKGNGMFSCKICGIGCSDQSSLDAHL